MADDKCFLSSIYSVKKHSTPILAKENENKIGKGEYKRDEKVDLEEEFFQEAGMIFIH